MQSERTTDLEDRLYDTLESVLQTLTKRKIERREYLEMMGEIVHAMKLYENKKYKTDRL